MSLVKWLLLVKMEQVTQVQLLDKAVGNSLYANALEKGMNPFVLPKLWVNSRAD